MERYSVKYPGGSGCLWVESHVPPVGFDQWPVTLYFEDDPVGHTGWVVVANAVFILKGWRNV